MNAPGTETPATDDRRSVVPVILVGAAVLGILLFVPVFLYCHRHLRMAAIPATAEARTQEVAVGFVATRLSWRLAGKVEGRGTVQIPGAITSRFSGDFTAEGSSKYQDSAARLIWLPEPGTTGFVEASFRFTAP